MQSQITLSVLAVEVLISSYVSTASLDCNHVVSPYDGTAEPVGVCFKEGQYSVMIECRNGEAYYKQWEFSQDCTGNHMYETDGLSEWDYEVVCDADPCQIAVVEDYHGDSIGQHYSG